MKQRINLLQFIVGGMLKKKNEGGFCSLSTKVYINNFPSRPSEVLVQTTPAFVSQILLHMTFDQSPQISSSKGKKKWGIQLHYKVVLAVVQHGGCSAHLFSLKIFLTRTLPICSNLLSKRENMLKWKCFHLLHGTSFTVFLKAKTYLVCTVSFPGFGKTALLILCFHKGEAASRSTSSDWNWATAEQGP